MRAQWLAADSAPVAPRPVRRALAWRLAEALRPQLTGVGLPPTRPAA